MINGNFIITAAHCIELHSSMFLDDYLVEDIETVLGNLKVSPLFVDPVSDIAICGSPDEEKFFDEAEMFESFCEQTKPLSLCLSEFKLFQNFPVYIYNLDRKWVKGNAVHNNYNPVFSIETNKPIESGSSGGPIVNELGELIGIISVASSRSSFRSPKTEYKYLVLAPRPHITLPYWITQKIKNENG